MLVVEEGAAVAVVSIAEGEVAEGEVAEAEAGVEEEEGAAAEAFDVRGEKLVFTLCASSLPSVSFHECSQHLLSTVRSISNLVHR